MHSAARFTISSLSEINPAVLRLQLKGIELKTVRSDTFKKKKKTSRLDLKVACQHCVLRSSSPCHRARDAPNFAPALFLFSSACPESIQSASPPATSPVCAARGVSLEFFVCLFSRRGNIRRRWYRVWRVRTGEGRRSEVKRSVPLIRSMPR